MAHTTIISVEIETDRPIKPNYAVRASDLLANDSAKKCIDFLNSVKCDASVIDWWVQGQAD